MPRPTPLTEIDAPDWLTASDEAPSEPAAPSAPVPAEELGTLVGTSTSQMKRDAARLIAADPDHPLRFLVDREGSFRSSAGFEHSELIDKPDLVQMGHIKSDKAVAEGEDKIMLQTAWRNQMQSVTVEGPGGHGAWVESAVAIDIGGVAVDRESAQEWEARGWLEQGTVDGAPVIEV